MSQPDPTPTEPTTPSPETPAAFPIWSDYLVILLGCAFSVILAGYGKLRVTAPDPPPSWLSTSIITHMPALLYLPIGIYLGWPVFFAVGRLRGRSGKLTSAEWTWGVLWLLDLLLIGLILINAGETPEFLKKFVDADMVRQSVGSILGWLSVAFAGLGIGLTVWTRFQKEPRPWTHDFALALMLWPLIPMSIIRLANLQVQF